MSSYWERRLQQNRQRSLQAQSDRYSAQVPAAVRDAQERRRVEQAERQRAQARVAQARREREERQRREAELAQQRAQADARVAQAQREREARELEAAQRAQAEARVNFAQSRREAEAMAEAERLSPTRSMFGEPVVPPSDPLEFYANRVEQQRQIAENAPLWEAIGFGPRRESVAGGEAGRPERFLRDWVFGEQELRAAGEAAGENRWLPALGWGSLWAAGMFPGAGEAIQLGVRGARTAGRAGGAAADVGRVSGRPILDDVVSEIRERGGVEFTKPNIESVPAERQLTAELSYRQGYENLPRVVDSDEFNSLAGRSSTRTTERLPFEYEGTGENVVLYRGFVDDAARSGEEYASELIGGDYRISPGDYGPGIYFGANPEEVLAYSARVGGQSDVGGSIVRAILPADAKMLDFSNSAVYREFDASPFTNLSEFAAARGYDGIVVPRSPNPADNYVVVLNRSILTFDQPRVVSRADAASVASGELPARSLLDNLFADASQSGRAADVGRAVDATEQTTKWANAWRRNATDDWRAPNISESVGKDLSSGSMEFTIPQAKLESIPEQRRETAEIFHRQQFDVEPQKIQSRFFDRAVDASNGIPIYRGLSASTIDEAAKYANQFLSGDYHIGVGFNGMGSYFGVDPRTALQYASMSSPEFRAGRPGAIVRGILPRSALIFDDSLDSNLTRSILTSFSRSPFDDLGMYLASIGYDGQRVVRGGDEYIVVYNRGILKMDDSVYNVPEGLRPQKDEGGWEGMSQILKNLYGEDFVR